MGWEQWLETGRFTLFRSAVIQEQFIQCIIDHSPAGCSISEAGFGFGTTLELLRDLDYNVSGFDLEPLAVSQTSERYPLLGGKLFVGDILDEKTYDNSTDIIIHQGVLEHFSDEEIIKILKLQMASCEKVIFDVPNCLRENLDDEGDDTRFETPEFWENIITESGFKFKRFGRTYDYGNDLLPDKLKRYDSDLMKKVGRSSIFVVTK